MPALTLLPRTLGAALLLTLALAGCSSPAANDDPPDQEAKVATLETDPPDAPDSSSTDGEDGDGERVRERLDMTPEEIERLYIPYEDCMKENGVDIRESRSQEPGPDKVVAGSVSDADIERAGKICNELIPLPAWEIDASNPDAVAFGRDVVACLRAKGVQYVELSIGEDIVGPSLGGPQNDSESITKGMELLPECQREVADQ